MNTQINSTYAKLLPTEDYEYGHVVRAAGKKDVLVKVGVTSFIDAQKWCHQTSTAGAA